MKTNVLYLSYDGMTDVLGQSQVLPYLTHLSKKFNLHLISFEKPHHFEQNKNIIQQICDDNSINWHPLNYTKNPPVFSTVYDIRKMLKLSKKLDDKYDFKIIHCRSYISAYIGLVLKKKRQKKFLFDMRGFWADERVEGGIWNLKNPVYKMIYNFFKKKEKQYFSFSDAIVSLTENGKNEILSWDLKMVSEEKITVIPCCVNLELFDPETIKKNEISEIKSKLKIGEDDFVLGYVGSIGTWYMLSEMLDYFKILSEEKTNAKFFFVTGENPDVILEKAKEKEIDTAQIIVDKCLHRDVPKYIATFNKSIFFILPVFSKKASSPTKQGELMAMGVPVVCNTNVGDTDFVINNYKSGVLVQNFTPQDYRESINTFDKTTFDGQKIKAGAKSFYGLEKGAEIYIKIYESLIN